MVISNLPRNAAEFTGSAPDAAAVQDSDRPKVAECVTGLRRKTSAVAKDSSQEAGADAD